MKRLDAKVVVITGAARGQGRAQAVRVAAEGGHVIAVDICADIPSNRYPMASRADLDQTASLVEKNGGRVVARVADVRDRAALAAAVALPHLGRGASIVATGSLAALIPGTLDNAAKGSGGLGYSWAKRAVASLVPDLSVVLAPKGIPANPDPPTNVT